MRRSSHDSIFPLICFLALCIAVNGQTVIAPASPHPNIHITALSNKAGEFPELTGIDLSAPPIQQSFVLHNSDPRDVVGLLAIWTITDNGNTSVRRLLSDKYISLVPTIALPSNKDIILTPRGWVVPSIYPAFWSMKTNWNSPSVNNIPSTATVSLSIDSVIFSDGRVCGPDNDHVGTILAARVTAAHNLAATLSKEVASADEWKASAQILTQNWANENDMTSEKYWTARFARQLLHTPNDVNALLTFFASLPSVPAFKNCNTL